MRKMMRTMGINAIETMENYHPLSKCSCKIWKSPSQTNINDLERTSNDFQAIKWTNQHQTSVSNWTWFLGFSDYVLSHSPLIWSYLEFYFSKPENHIFRRFGRKLKKKITRSGLWKSNAITSLGMINQSLSLVTKTKSWIIFSNYSSHLKSIMFQTHKQIFLLILI